MNLKLNVASNYLSQAYVALIGIIMTPFYIKYMGMEAYGLVGFFAMAQAWMQLLDFGLSSTLGREASKFKAGTTSAESLKAFLNLLELVFFLIGLIVVFFSWAFGDWITSSWLKLNSLNFEEVKKCVQFVSIILGGRLISGVYRGGLLGLEQQVTANIISVILATLKSVMVLPVLIWVSNSILTFFQFQLVTALIEILFLKRALEQFLPSKLNVSFEWALLKEPLKFSASMFFLTWVWIACSQADKLILSHLLPMADYGGFILATTITTGINLIVLPLQQAVLPRLTILITKNQQSQVIALYEKTTLLIAAMLSGVVGVLITFPSQVLYVWTGSFKIAIDVSEILKWYSIGTGLVGLVGMSYLLQHAHGNLKLHLKANIVVLLVLIPAVIYSTLNYGALGAAIVWAIINALFLFIWTPIVHKRFLPAVQWSWLSKDVLPAISITAILFFIGQSITLPSTSRFVLLFYLMLIGGLVTIFTLFIQTETRQFMLFQFQKLTEKYG